MTTNTAKLIRIGDSAGVTIPARDLKRVGLKPGDFIEFSFRPVEPSADTHSIEVVELTQKLIARHQNALQNLSRR